MAIVFIACSSAASGGAALSGAASQDSTGADFFIVASASYGSTSNISDSRGLSWTPLGSTVKNNYTIQLWYAKNANGGPGHTFSTDAANYPAIVVLSFSGVDTGSPFDATAGESSGTNGTPTADYTTLGSLTPTLANSLFVTGLCTNITATGATIDSSFATPTNFDVASAVEAAIAYFVPSAGAKAPVWLHGGNSNAVARMAVFAPGSSGTTINVPAGAVAISGLAPTLLYSELPVPTGVIAIAGLSPALQFIISVTVGAVAISGLPPTAALVIQAKPIDIGAPFGIQIGAEGGLPTTPVSITVPLGNVAVTGQAPALLTSVVVPAGSVAIAGRAESVQLAVGVPGSALVITGTSPSVQVAVGIPVGSVIIAGVAPSISGAITASPGVGSVVLAGLAPTVTVTGVEIAVPAGAVVVAGFAPAMRLALGIPVGSVQIVGFAPSFAPGTTITPGVGAISVTGFAPSVLLGLLVTVPCGGVSVSGVAPTLQTVIGVPVGRITMTGLSPVEIPPALPIDWFVVPASDRWITVEPED